MSKIDSARELKEKLSVASLPTKKWYPDKSYRDREAQEAAEVHDASPHRTKHKKVTINTTHPAWKKLGSVFSQAFAWWRLNTFDWPVTGQRAFYRDRRDEIKEEIATINRRIKMAASALDDAREDLIRDYRENLGRLFDPSVYPESWREEFSIGFIEFSIDPPEYLKLKDVEEYQQEMQRIIQNVQWSQQEFERSCNQNLAEATARMMVNLQGSGVGGLNDNIAAIRGVIDRVMQMRFEGTQAFNNALQEFEDLVEGVDVQEIRKRKSAKQEATQKLQTLLQRHQQLQDLIRKKGAKEDGNNVEKG